jgi:hypothetical protein
VQAIVDFQSLPRHVKLAENVPCTEDYTPIVIAFHHHRAVRNRDREAFRRSMIASLQYEGWSGRRLLTHRFQAELSSFFDLFGQHLCRFLLRLARPGRQDNDGLAQIR